MNAPGVIRLKVFGIVRRGERLLVLRLAAGHSRAGEWDLPGGKVDFGEDPRAGLIREAFEETGLTFTLGRPVLVQSRTQSNEQDVVITFLLEGGDGEIQLSDEHDDFRWLRRAEVLGLKTAYHVLPALEALERPR